MSEAVYIACGLLHAKFQSKWTNRSGLCVKSNMVYSADPVSAWTILAAEGRGQRKHLLPLVSGLHTSDQNVHVSMVFDEVYDKVTENFPQVEAVVADVKEKHAMRYTQYRGSAQVTNWVKLKFVARSLKSWHCGKRSTISLPPLLIRQGPGCRLSAQPGFSANCPRRVSGGGFVIGIKGKTFRR